MSLITSAWAFLADWSACPNKSPLSCHPQHAYTHTCSFNKYQKPLNGTLHKSKLTKVHQYLQYFRLQNYLYCVAWGVKLYSLSHLQYLCTGICFFSTLASILNQKIQYGGSVVEQTADIIPITHAANVHSLRRTILHLLSLKTAKQSHTHEMRSHGTTPSVKRWLHKTHQVPISPQLLTNEHLINTYKVYFNLAAIGWIHITYTK